MDLLATLFVEPILVTGLARLAMLGPLCLSVAVVYKTLKLADLRRLVASCAALWAVMVGGLMAVGVVLLVVYELIR
jgi:hypothetical protein